MTFIGFCMGFRWFGVFECRVRLKAIGVVIPLVVLKLSD